MSGRGSVFRVEHPVRELIPGSSPTRFREYGRDHSAVALLPESWAKRLTFQVVAQCTGHSDHEDKAELREAIMTLENAAPGRSWHQDGNRSGFVDVRHVSIPYGPLNSSPNKTKTPR